MSDQFPDVTVDLIAGRHPGGDWVFERLLVTRQPGDNRFQLLKSPVFVRGIARGDVIERQGSPEGAFRVIERSGNLCLRILTRQSFREPALDPLRQALVAEIEKLGGDLDIDEPQVLVFSVHVAIGFDAIETLLNRLLAGHAEVAWFYGNVYDADSGEPLDWWQPMLSPQ